MILNIFDTVEVVSAQPLSSDGAVVAFYVGVLLGIAWLDILTCAPSILQPMKSPWG